MSNSVRKYSDPIPVDLLIDIFSRVPAKSIARFRCVSKLWASILVRQDFTELFLTKSSTRPRLLFTFEVNEELFVFSSPQPQNPDKNLSLVTTRYKNFPRCIPTDICHLFFERGLVFLQNRGRKVRVICNPATGESVTLPKVTATDDDNSCLGIDPINKQFKVLCMSYGKPNTHRVLTLEAGELLWRTIQDQVSPHSPRHDEICINGGLYYGADFEKSSMIVCFDFRSEKFSFINIDTDMLREDCSWTLFNYKGKLGVLQHKNWTTQLVLWVLEDVGIHKWSKTICVQLPDKMDKKIVGMTGTGDIVFSPYFLSNPFYLLFYNIEMNTFTRVYIQGFEEFKQPHLIFHTSLDYVENMKFM